MIRGARKPRFVLYFVYPEMWNVQYACIAGQCNLALGDYMSLYKNTGRLNFCVHCTTLHKNIGCNIM